MSLLDSCFSYKNVCSSATMYEKETIDAGFNFLQTFNVYKAFNEKVAHIDGTLTYL